MTGALLKTRPTSTARWSAILSALIGAGLVAAPAVGSGTTALLIGHDFHGIMIIAGLIIGLLAPAKAAPAGGPR